MVVSWKNNFITFEAVLSLIMASTTLLPTSKLSGFRTKSGKVAFSLLSLSVSRIVPLRCQSIIRYKPAQKFKHVKSGIVGTGV